MPARHCWGSSAPRRIPERRPGERTRLARVYTKSPFGSTRSLPSGKLVLYLRHDHHRRCRPAHHPSPSIRQSAHPSAHLQGRRTSRDRSSHVCHREMKNAGKTCSVLPLRPPPCLGVQIGQLAPIIIKYIGLRLIPTFPCPPARWHGSRKSNMKRIRSEVGSSPPK